jgi:hypothetical protein
MCSDVTRLRNRGATGVQGTLGAPSDELAAVPRMRDPLAGDGDGVDVERHALGDAGVLERGDEPGDAPALAACEQLDRLVVVAAAISRSLSRATSRTRGLERQATGPTASARISSGIRALSRSHAPERWTA